MTGRALLVTAAAALVVAALGMTALPLLGDGPDGDRLPTRQFATTLGPASAPVAIAIDAAVTALGCAAPSSPRHPGCGQLAVTEAAGYLAGPERAIVRITATLSTTDGPPLPFALQVRLLDANGRWTPTVVTP